VVVAVEHAVAGTVLVAYLTPGSLEVSGEQLRAWLGARLPAHMVPTAFVWLEVLPVTANGKLDRKALPAADLTTGGTGRGRPPETHTERTIADLVVAALGLDPATDLAADDSWFRVGGDSITALTLVRLAHGAGLSITNRDVFEYQTVEQLASRADSNNRGRDESSTFMTPLIAAELSANKAPNTLRHSYIVELPGDVDRERLEAAINAVVARHSAFGLRLHRDTTSGDKPVLIDVGLIPPEPLDHVDVTDLQSIEDILELERRYADELDITDGPVHRSGLITRESGRPLLVWTIHQFVVDRPSRAILLDELRDTYARVISGDAPASSDDTVLSWMQDLSGDASGSEVTEDSSDRGCAHDAYDTVLCVPTDLGTTIDALCGRAGIDIGVALGGAAATALHRAREGGGRPVSPDVLLDVERDGRRAQSENQRAVGAVGQFTELHPTLIAVPTDADSRGLDIVAAAYAGWNAHQPESVHADAAFSFSGITREDSATWPGLHGLPDVVGAGDHAGRLRHRITMRGSGTAGTDGVAIGFTITAAPSVDSREIEALWSRFLDSLRRIADDLVALPDAAAAVSGVVPESRAIAPLPTHHRLRGLQGSAADFSYSAVASLERLPEQDVLTGAVYDLMVSVDVARLRLTAKNRRLWIWDVPLPQIGAAEAAARIRDQLPSSRPEVDVAAGRGLVATAGHLDGRPHVMVTAHAAIADRATVAVWAGRLRDHLNSSPQQAHNSLADVTKVFATKAKDADHAATLPNWAAVHALAAAATVPTGALDHRTHSAPASAADDVVAGFAAASARYFGDIRFDVDRDLRAGGGLVGAHGPLTAAVPHAVAADTAPAATDALDWAVLRYLSPDGRKALARTAEANLLMTRLHAPMVDPRAKEGFEGRYDLVFRYWTDDRTTHLEYVGPTGLPDSFLTEWADCIHRSGPQDSLS
ncbi:condensation domain-containing protein, partial [Williamsia limnetica]|uniref:condensation domain-containing protein n=1 Tax=Williamsia limnetica TaxID=882452 RepID=UPI0011B7DE86